MKGSGVKFYDYEGKETPLMEVAHDPRPGNYIRIRIWNWILRSNGHYYGWGNKTFEPRFGKSQRSYKLWHEVIVRLSTISEFLGPIQHNNFT
ncbi:hypothetical protein JL36_10115 [Lactococcus cremoris]|nr:hypothetical protein JL36_10115 [Lactococcus cremoris]